jgi:hypothetical protein
MTQARRYPMPRRLALVTTAAVLIAPLTILLPSSVSPVRSAQADIPDVVTVMAFPDEASMVKVPLGGTYSMLEVPATVTSVGSVYSVKVDPSDVPAGALSDTGVVNLQIQVTDPDTGGVDTASVSLQTASAASGKWKRTATLSRSVAVTSHRHQFSTFKVRLDPSRPANQASRESNELLFDRDGDGGSDSLPLTAGQIAAWDEWATGSSESDTDDRSGAASCRQQATTKVWTTVGSSYPVGGDNSWLTYSSSESTSTGVAYSYGGGSFSQEGTKSTEDAWGENFPKHSYMRTYRIQIRYRLSYCYNIITGFGWYQVDPVNQTGGTESYALSGDRPDWSRCAPVGEGQWYRGVVRGTDYSNSEGAKIYDVLGIYLSSSHKYSTGTRSYYAIPEGGRRICGSNDDAATAGKIMERL